MHLKPLTTNTLKHLFPAFVALFLLTLGIDTALAQHVTAPTMNFNQEGELIGGAPSMAVFNNKMYISFQGQNSNHLLFIDSSNDGVTLNGAVQFTSISVGSTPTLAVFNGKLYTAFVAANGSNLLFVCSTSDVVTFSCQQTGIYLIGTPSMAVFKNKLYIAFETQVGNQLGITSSSDGVNFQTPATLLSTKIGSPPALVVYNNQLVAGFQADDSSHDLFLQASNDGTNFLTAYEYATRIKTTPALIATASGGAYATLMVSFEGNDSNQNIWFQPFVGITGPYSAVQNAAQIGSAPAELDWVPPVGQFAGNETIFAAFRSYNSSDRLFLGGQRVQIQ